MIAFPEEADSDRREARAHHVVYACGTLADQVCAMTHVVFPDVSAAQMAHLHAVVTAAGVAAATLLLAPLPISAEEGERLAGIVTDSLDESDQLTLGLVDDCVLTIKAAVVAFDREDPPLTDPMITFGRALADWVANNAFGRATIDHRKVRFARKIGRTLVRPMGELWVNKR